MASNFYRQADGPRYILGHGLEIGFICLGILAASILVAGYVAVNKKRARQVAEGRGHEFTPEELSVLGDRAITFRYMY